MATNISPSEIEELRRRISSLEAMPISTRQAAPRTSWLLGIIQTLSFAGILGAAFWLESLNSTVASTAAKVDRLTDAMTSASKDSLNSRMAVMETRITAIDTKLDTIDKKLDRRASK
jgi:hypothetical protein